MKVKSMLTLLMATTMFLFSCNKNEKIIEEVATTGSIDIEFSVQSGVLDLTSSVRSWDIELELYANDSYSPLQIKTTSNGRISFDELLPGNYEIYAEGNLRLGNDPTIYFTYGETGAQVIVGQTHKAVLILE